MAAAENYTNNYSVFVASSLTSSATSMAVSQSAPIDGGFRVMIESELIYIVSGGTTTTWTITRGVESTAAASHSSGTAIYVILTAAAITNLFAQRGSYVLLERHTAISGTDAILTFTDWYSSSFDLYQIAFESVAPSTTGAVLYLQCSTDGGSTYDSGSNYSYSHLVWSHLGLAEGGGDGQTYFQLFPYASRTMVTGTSRTLNGRIELFNPGGSNYKNFSGSFLGDDSANSSAAQSLEVRNFYLSTTPVNAFSINISTGTFGGTVSCYGVVN